MKRFQGLLMAVVMFFMLGVIFLQQRNSQQLRADLKSELDKANQIIAEQQHLYQHADSIYLKRTLEIDSIARLRHENHTNPTHITIDSLRGFFSERYPK